MQLLLAQREPIVLLVCVRAQITGFTAILYKLWKNDAGRADKRCHSVMRFKSVTRNISEAQMKSSWSEPEKHVCCQSFKIKAHPDAVSFFH